VLSDPSDLVDLLECEPAATRHTGQESDATRLTCTRPFPGPPPKCVPDAELIEKAAFFNVPSAPQLNPLGCTPDWYEPYKLGSPEATPPAVLSLTACVLAVGAERVQLVFDGQRTSFRATGYASLPNRPKTQLAKTPAPKR
jgi:hypothetical protein